MSNEDAAGRYLTFGLGQESFGVPIEMVREIIGAVPVTPIPNSPIFLKGVINLRGKVLPVVNLRLNFGLEEKETTKETCFIIIDVDDLHIGVIVDSVKEVMDFNEENIDPPDVFRNWNISDSILGLGKKADKVHILVNLSKCLSKEEALSATNNGNQVLNSEKVA